MIKLKDIAEKYGEYEIDESKLKEILIEPKPKTVWDIKENDYYYFLDSRGCIGTDTWRNYDKDYERAGIANIFLTREDAEFERERLKVETELLKYGGTRDMMSLNDSDFKKSFIRNYILYFPCRIKLRPWQLYIILYKIIIFTRLITYRFIF